MQTFTPFKPFRFTLAFLGVFTLLIATSYFVLSATQGRGKKVLPRVGQVGIETTSPSEKSQVNQPGGKSKIPFTGSGLNE